MTKLYFFLSFVCVSVLSKTQDSNLVVMDNKTRQEVVTYLVKKSDESLELTCKLKNNTDEQVSLSWLMPFSESNGTMLDDDEELFNETSISPIQRELSEDGSIKLFVNSLQASHTGSYTCVSISNTTGKSVNIVKLIVKPKKVICSKQFECDDKNCIPLVYKCDGVADCKSKNDEAPEICGLDPCLGRVKCSTGRCIPTDWCKVCDPPKTNCTHRHRHDCCPILQAPLGLFPYSDGTYSRRFNEFPEPNMQHQYDINFIQTTIYTIIGCVLIFMVIVTIFVIAICRVHLKRSQPALLNNRRVLSTTAYHRAFTHEIGVYDVDLAMNRCDGPGLLVTYNINNGVQIVGSPVDPPPYSEVASLPPREGPPPPYALSQPYDGDNLPNVRSVECETSPKPGDLRRGLSPLSRVSSEPSLPNHHRL